MPTYRVTLKCLEEPVDIQGYLECRQMASLVFTDDTGTILRIFAPGTWDEVSLVYG